MRLTTREDITLEAVRRVAWAGEGVELAPDALERMDRAHASFAALVEARLAEDPAALIYGVTTAPGDGATEVLSEERRARRPTHMWTAASFGEPLPERVTRAIVLARLANLLGGHATIRAEVAAAVTAMLESPLPPVPSQGNGGAGEILALGHLFYAIPERFELAPKERMALVNGSPCAAALVADAALAGARRLALAEQVFALAAAVLGVPLEAYGAELEPLWDDPHETAALRSLRALLESDGGMRQAHQAPVSFRILPRVLGAVRRAQAAAEEAAAISLRSVTDNPVYVPPTDRPPLGAVFSTGGYHDARAPAALDGVAFAWTDLCQLAARATDRLFQHPGTAAVLARDEWTVKPLHMVATGWAEEARALAQPSLLSLGGFGQNDMVSPSFLAWRKADAVGRCLDGALAVLGALGAQALRVAGEAGPPALAGLVGEVQAVFSPHDGPRRLGDETAQVAAAFTARVFSPGSPAPGRPT